ncbi:glutamine synthetase [Hathewaya histolytica]|uniref:Glutamine synthetase n=1 Tax=Hathewaya histolytica TaxID=1498 RepID=A0A4U9RTL2_HATHI|nr:glutamine synthetase [Hathewaya histolytica]VTQ92340.1 glutamine synthetase [Hathewaya histolytica]
MLNNLIYTITKENHSPKIIKEILSSHSEIKFVSFMGVDLSGNDTDERIPINLFIEDIEKFLYGNAIQTDGSSVVLPGIATLNNAKLDMIADLDCNWFIDYNYENIDPITNLPIGTLKIPCFLFHDNTAVDSRHILKNSINVFKENLLNIFKENPHICKEYKFTFEDIKDINFTVATELEFWVKTPNDKAHIEQLTTSQVLKEQYWTRTKGAVRTSLEQCLLIMESYGFNPEMGHKEVGGVKAQLDQSGTLTHIMEQLEIDWKYSDAIQACDNEIFIRNIVKESFRQNGLDVNFLAKPINDVAGSGEHVHISVSVELRDGKTINLFTSTSNHFLSKIGYGSLMGILKNYEGINPFISSTNDSLKRLKPGFEAPVCIVTSLGHEVNIPSRNRTILIALIRDLKNPYATRFEVRSPNPHTNTYLAVATLYLSMIEGIEYAIKNNKSEDELLKELSKLPEEDASYLLKDRAYRSEQNVFEDFTESEREKYFGKAPRTVYENIKNLDHNDITSFLKRENVFNDKLINSFKLGAQRRWLTEIQNRILNDYSDEIRNFKMIHSIDKALDLDVANWQKINYLRHYLMKDSYTEKSLFTKIKEAIDKSDYDEVSNLQVELEEKMESLRSIYSVYIKNLIDI